MDPKHDFAHVDLERQDRCGQAEVIFGQGKTPEQIVEIACRLHQAGQGVLITRTGKDAYAALRDRFPQATFHDAAGVITIAAKEKPATLGTIAVCAAGTSDLPVAEEAALCAEFFGMESQRIYDVGVAGLHRLLGRVEDLRQVDLIIVVAGMEGALSSVVAGLVACPVIAVPTSVGYGTHLNGLAPLLTMLNSCASGLTVVNVDNGFGAASAAARILRLKHKP